MATLMYRCPRTGMNVPLPFALEPASTDKAQEYESVTCPACTRLHLISKSTGKLLSDKIYSTTTLGGVDTYRIHKMIAARVTTAR